MPIYEFHCETCESDSEILVRSAAWQDAKCPRCGSAKLDKKFSTFAATGAGNNTSASQKTGGGRSGGGCCGGHCHGGH